jgi:hypothetical protein
VWESWDRVRTAKTYPSVIARANEWLEELWPDAYRLGYSPKGIGNQGTRQPWIYISNSGQNPDFVAGWFGPWATIKIISVEHMRKHADRYRWPVRDFLRETILHEVQHALDWSRGVSSEDHNSHYTRRLRRLLKDFPDTQL